jgi:hypothetical protein
MYFERQDGNTTDDVIDQCIYATHMSTTITDQEGNTFYDAYQHSITEAPTPTQVITPKTTVKRSPDFQLLCPFFGWMSPDIIQKTFEHTTQYARIPTGTMLKKAFRSPHPALNVYRRNEDIACDIAYSNVPAIFDGSTTAVIFFGTSSKVTDVNGIKRDSQFANTLEDTIIQRGAPNRLLSDRGQAIISHKVEDILQTFCIDKWQSETHQHHQNPAERRYQTVKNATNRILDPAHLWLLCLQYVCYLLSHTYNMTIDAVPLTKLLGSTVDISPLLRFHFWERVYYHQSETSFPSNLKEGLGNKVGISEHCGHALTYKVLTADTGHVIYCSLLRPVTTGDPNLCQHVCRGERHP